jgi:tRNA(Ile)-lysidine synthetase-like protein
MMTEGESAAPGIESRVLASIRAGSLLSPGDVVVAGVSGGPDSLCLLHLLHRLREPLSLRVHVAHLDHMLRGVESRDEARFVAVQAALLGLECSLDEADVAAYSRAHRLGLEEAGRVLRYGFLRGVALRVGARCVAAGHTRDDSAETVLMNLVRGAGIHGLRGLEPVSRLPLPSDYPVEPAAHEPLLVRPLLVLSRRDTERYCAALGLEPRVDASNESPEFLRNRVRRELLPLLRGMNPGVDDALLRLAASARMDDDCLCSLADAVWQRDVLPGDSNLYLSGQAFLDAHPALQSRLVRRAFELLVGSARDVTAAHVRAVQSLAAGAGGKSVRLAHGVTWRKEADRLVAFVAGKDPSTHGPLMPVEPVRLAIPGVTAIAGWQVSACIVDSCAIPDNGGEEAVFDLERIGPDVNVRRRRPGDRIRPLGMEGEKKLQDVMVDCKVPAMARDRVPVVCAGRDVAWVVGCRVSEQFKVTPDTRSVLVLRFDRSRS